MVPVKDIACVVEGVHGLSAIRCCDTGRGVVQRVCPCEISTVMSDSLATDDIIICDLRSRRCSAFEFVPVTVLRSTGSPHGIQFAPAGDTGIAVSKLVTIPGHWRVTGREL